MPERIASRRALVLYGSETGTAQDLAEELGRTAQRLLFATQVLSLDAIKLDVLNSFSLVLIAISTTGQGDLPANAKGLWKQLLRRKLPATYLSGTKYALFGLGDSSYPQYNWAALKLNKRLKQLGATEIIPHGEGDEQHPEGSDAAIVPWLQQLKSEILEVFPLPDGKAPVADNVLLQPPWLLGEVLAESVAIASHDDGDSAVASLAQGDSTPTASASTPFEVTLTRNDRLTPPTHFQDVRHLALTTQEAKPYVPGDVLMIYPHNHPDDVEQLIKVMRWEDAADKAVCLVPNAAYVGSERPDRPVSSSLLNDPSSSLTFRAYLTTHLDFNAIPRRSFFSLLAHFTSDEFQKERLLEFANIEFIDELFDYTTRPRRSILEVLQEFDTLDIPWQWASVILPQLRGRQFSIASGGSHKRIVGDESTGTKFELLVAIVKYRTVIKKIRRGVCTRYLEHLPVGSQIRVSLHKGSLAPTPEDVWRPAVLVGPGTGLAPMRALIWERWAWQQMDKASKSSEASAGSRQPPAVSLFFGCRSRNADYFFEQEWQSLRKLGMPIEVFPAFSRDQDQKVYVQDRIREQYQLVYESLCEQDGLFFVCGSSGKMPQAVRSALMDAMQKGGDMRLDEAEQMLKIMEKSGRYKQETW